MIDPGYLLSKTSDVSQPRFQELDETIRLLNTRLEVAERNLRQVQDEREKLIAQRSRLEGDITLLKVSFTFFLCDRRND